MQWKISQANENKPMATYIKYENGVFFIDTMTYGRWKSVIAVELLARILGTTVNIICVCPLVKLRSFELFKESKAYKASAHCFLSVVVAMHQLPFQVTRCPSGILNRFQISYWVIIVISILIHLLLLL